LSASRGFWNTCSRQLFHRLPPWWTCSKRQLNRNYKVWVCVCEYTIH
jgi:hypothetical protein